MTLTLKISIALLLFTQVVFGQSDVWPFMDSLEKRSVNQKIMTSKRFNRLIEKDIIASVSNSNVAPNEHLFVHRKKQVYCIRYMLNDIIILSYISFEKAINKISIKDSTYQSVIPISDYTQDGSPELMLFWEKSISRDSEWGYYRGEEKGMYILDPVNSEILADIKLESSGNGWNMCRGTNTYHYYSMHFDIKKDMLILKNKFTKNQPKEISFRYQNGLFLKINNTNKPRIH